MILKRVVRYPAWQWRSPFSELERMREEMDRLSEGYSRGAFREPSAGVFPLMNVTENRDSFFIRAELPGLKADDLDISVTGDNLSISGERKIPEESEKVKYHRKEREAGRFSRILSLPGQIDSEKAEAKCADGILTIVLPKKEASKPRQIAIQSS